MPMKAWEVLARHLEPILAASGEMAERTLDHDPRQDSAAPLGAMAGFRALGTANSAGRRLRQVARSFEGMGASFSSILLVLAGPGEKVR